MTVSEKLAALDERRKSGPTGSGVRRRAQQELGNALPQIRALVEVAEAIASGERPADSPAWTTGKSWRIELARSALADLDKALGEQA